MLKVKIFSVGKIKEKWLTEAWDEYTKRLQAFLQIECIWAKNNEQLIEWLQKEKSYICLDPSGLKLTSEEFATFLSSKWEQAGSRLQLVIGGAEGIPIQLKQNSPLISLSPLTFTHQITRLILIEQLYRTIEIQKNSKYHK